MTVLRMYIFHSIQRKSVTGRGKRPSSKPKRSARKVKDETSVDDNGTSCKTHRCTFTHYTWGGGVTVVHASVSVHLHVHISLVESCLEGGPPSPHAHIHT